MELSDILVGQFLGFGLVFSRLGSTLMFMPGFGESQVPVRYRVFFALVLSLALYPATPVGALYFENFLQFIPLLAIEITIGLWIGLTARILMSALQFAGYQIGMVAGLANAFAPNIGAFQGATMVASVLLMAEAALIFVTDLHHVIIRALLMSYEIFPPGVIIMGDLTQQLLKTVGKSFYIGISLAAPFYVIGLVLNTGLGLANRMMPALPVFFVAGPVLIGAGLFVLAISGGTILQGFHIQFNLWLQGFSF